MLKLVSGNKCNRGEKIIEMAESENIGAIPKKRGANREWDLLRVFATTSDAREFIESEGRWKVNRLRDTHDGHKTEYRCNASGLKNTCLCKLQLYQPSDSLEAHVLLFGDHDHQEKERELIPSVADRIVSLATNKMKPKFILTQLRCENVENMPSLKQIQNLIYRKKCKRFETDKISLGDLGTWLKAHSVVPEDENKSFILKYETSTPLDDEPYFRFAVSTKYWLKYAHKSANVHADATYKITWQGYPMFVIGCTDMQRQFHPLILGLASNETHDDYAFMFRALKCGVEEIMRNYYENIL